MAEIENRNIPVDHQNPGFLLVLLRGYAREMDILRSQVFTFFGGDAKIQVKRMIRMKVIGLDEAPKILSHLRRTGTLVDQKLINSVNYVDDEEV